MKKWNLIIDVAKCEDCNNCFLACKDEHVGNDFPGYSTPQARHGPRWINIMRKERGKGSLMEVAYLPVPCMHCDNPPCMKAAKNHAIYKRDDGIVIIDPQKAKGQRGLVDACPYGAIWWNEESGMAQKCTFCAHLLDKGWKEPRCTQVCASGALRAVHAEDAEMGRVIETENLEAYQPQHGTMPRVYYKNLYKYTSCFIAGSVAVDTNGTLECAGGAQVRLMHGLENVGETETDNYGDFKFDGLKEGSGLYAIEITYKNYPDKRIEINLIESVNIDDILL